MRLDHANLVVRDLAAQTAFYRDVLGFEVVLERELSGDWVDALLGGGPAVMDCAILQPPGGGARIELLAYRTPAPIEIDGLTQPSALGLRHIAFDVDNLDQIVKRLQDAEVVFFAPPVTVPFPVNGGRKRLVYFLDPEGVMCELAEYRAWPGQPEG